MEDKLFEHIYGRPPELESNDGEAKQFRALEKALEATTEEDPGTPMQFDIKASKVKTSDDLEWW